MSSDPKQLAEKMMSWNERIASKQSWSVADELERRRLFGQIAEALTAQRYVPQPSPIKTIPLIKRLKEQRDELAEAMRPLMALLREEEWHMRARRYAEPYSRAMSALDKCPTYEQQLRNVAEGIGMTYEELLSAFSRCELQPSTKEKS